MPAETDGRFGYWRDPVFLACLAAYVVNRTLIKPHLHHYSALFHGHLDDTLTVPVALPIYILFYRWIGLRPDDEPPRWWEVLLHTAVWILFFKWFAPFTLHQSVYDPIDIWCIAGGGLFAWVLWQRGELSRIVLTKTEDEDDGGRLRRQHDGVAGRIANNGIFGHAPQLPMISRLVLITTYVVLLNCAYAGLLLWLLRRRKPWPKLIGVGVCLWTLLMIALFLLGIFQPDAWIAFLRHWLYFPMAVEMIWNVLLLEFLVLGLILVVLAVRHLRPNPDATPLTPEGMSRRRFLYLAVCGAAPATTLGMGVHGTLTRHDLRVREFQVPIANLPPELEGFAIAHVSDLHSGVFCGPSRLKIIRDATNDLKADLVTITGDIINREMSEFSPALAAMRRIQSRYGMYLCEGNHDIIPGPGLVVRACAENQLPMLYNSCVAIPIRGRRLLIGGLPWMKHGFEGQPEIVSRLFPAREDGDVRILLAHHPHLFDIAESADLVLAGHTHGGQIMLGDEIGFGPLLFKYWSGLYQRGNTRMIVSNGGGDWFPCRIGAPAEIGLLRLTRA